MEPFITDDELVECFSVCLGSLVRDLPNFSFLRARWIAVAARNTRSECSALDLTPFVLHCVCVRLIDKPHNWNWRVSSLITQPKNRAPAEKQITAEQLVREAQEFKTEPFQKQKTIITDRGNARNGCCNLPIW